MLDWVIKFLLTIKLVTTITNITFAVHLKYIFCQLQFTLVIRLIFPNNHPTSSGNIRQTTNISTTFWLSMLGVGECQTRCTNLGPMLTQRWASHHNIGHAQWISPLQQNFILLYADWSTYAAYYFLNTSTSSFFKYLKL